MVPGGFSPRKKRQLVLLAITGVGDGGAGGVSAPQKLDLVKIRAQSVEFGQTV